MQPRELWAWVNREQIATPALAVVFLLLSAWMVSLPHDIEQQGHLKDEEGYYAWALLYRDGYWSLPLELADGDYRSEETLSIDPEAPLLNVTCTQLTLDDDGRRNDLRVTVTHANGSAATGATVRVPLPGGGAIAAVTDDEGRAELRDLPPGQPPLEVVLPRPGEPPLVVRTHVTTGEAGTGRYGVSTTTAVTYLSNRTLGGLLELQLPNGQPARDHNISFNGHHFGRTDDGGRLMLGELGTKRGAFAVTRPDDEPAGGLPVMLAGRVLGETDAQGRLAAAVVERVQLAVTVRDTFGGAIAGAVLTLTPTQGGQPTALGESAANGTLRVVQELALGEYRLTVRHVVDGYAVPLASGIAEVDGEYHYVNHWPPGPSVALLPLLAVGGEALFGALMAALTGAATYGLGRRWWGWRVAWLGTLLTLGNGVVLMLHFGQWMGDLAAVAFALPGLWLVVEGAHRAGAAWRRAADTRLNRSAAAMVLAGGVLMGVGVTMRYTTVLLCGAPYLYLAWYNMSPGVLRELPQRLRAALAWPRVREPLLHAGALTLGLLLIGLPLAAYNAHYFGTAFNSGYQSKHTLQVSGDDDNQTIETHEPAVSMWDSYVNWGAQERENLGQVAKFVAAFFPALLLVGPGLWVARRSAAATLALVYWILALVATYLTQGWVLNNVFTDIRYYLPLAPAAGLLAALGLRALARALPWGSVVAGAVVALVVASGWVAWAETEDNLQVRFAQQPGGGGPAPQIIDVSISELVAHPEQYYDRMVRVIAEATEHRGSVLLVLADDKKPATTMQLVLGPHAVAAEPGDRVRVVAQFHIDDKSPDGHSLFLQRAEDFQVLMPAGGRAVVAAQEPPPGGPPGGSPQGRGKIDLSPGQVAALALGVTAALLFHGAALVAWRRRRNKRGQP